jgi:hypothetical protein
LPDDASAIRATEWHDGQSGHGLHAQIARRADSTPNYSDP